MTSPASPWPSFTLALRLFLPVAVSIASYGVVWGVLAGQAGLSPLEVVLMSGLVYAGSSQFVALTMWSPTSLPIVSIIVAAAIINLRMLLMTATLRPLFNDMPRWRALLSMFLVSDEVWAMTMGQTAKGETNGAAFMLGCGALAWTAWLASTLTGRLLGAVIDDPTTYGLDFAFTATFLALLFGMWKGKADLLPWLTGGLIAIAVSYVVPGTWYIIAGGLGGSLIGAIAQHRSQARVA
ncbi:MAG: branched-chain amino acid ABC transporter permease [Hyphomicrobiales bacterium]|nr:MAG: branched-chain amino acid ABC transporter permease [Hyphomicrobiales bacterium]